MAGRCSDLALVTITCLGFVQDKICDMAAKFVIKRLTR